MRTLPPEEVARVGSVLMPRALVSLVLQGLQLVLVVRSVRQVRRNRRLGVRPLLRPADTGSLVGLSVLELLLWGATARWLSRWAARARATTAG